MTTSTETKPIYAGTRSKKASALVYTFAVMPSIALIAAILLLGISWLNLVLLIGFYFGTGLCVTTGYHRYFTHGAFKTKEWLKAVLGIGASMALQGPPLQWVGDHRRHHAYSDREGDPHSPWAYGTSPWGIARGFGHAHMGWLWDKRETNQERFAPDLMKDKTLLWVDKYFMVWAVLSLALPALIGGLATWSWYGAFTAFIWGGLVRISVLHHVTWSINSICHMIGDRPFAARDRSANVWPLAILSMGESWHNLHHADPTSARHGVKRGQIDMTARLIWIFEKFGWATKVRWPRPERLERLTAITPKD